MKLKTKPILLAVALPVLVAACDDVGSFQAGHAPEPAYQERNIVSGFWANLKKPHPPLRYIQRGPRGHWDREVHR